MSEASPALNKNKYYEDDLCTAVFNKSSKIINVLMSCIPGI